MGRLAESFRELKLADRKGFIPFVTAGDPSLNISESILGSLAKSGADIIELGVPFSDPMADGPTIQRSSQRALAGGTRLADVLEIARRFRHHYDIPLVLFSYLNPLIAYGPERLARDAHSAGIDGILITDAVDREAQQFSRIFSKSDIDLISLIAPTTSEIRLENICKNAKGFLYAVSRAGVTGARQDSSTSAEALVKRAREYTDLPIAVGFGISTSAQVQEVWNYADAAVVGSAIVGEIERRMSDNDIDSSVASFVQRLHPQFAKTLSEN